MAAACSMNPVDLRKLPLHLAPVCGRESPLEVLDSVFDICTLGESAFVEIYGRAGAGKSTLLHLRRDYWTTSPRNALIACGKYEYCRSSEPFSAIADALHELVTLWMDSKTKKKNETTNNNEDDEDDDDDDDEEMKQFELVFKSGGTFLQKILPRIFERINNIHATNSNNDSPLSLSSSSSSSIVPGEKGGGLGEAQTESSATGGTAFAICLQAEIRKLVSFLCKSTRPIVFFLDDLQWADQGSLDIVKLLALSELPGLLLVTTYREEEQHPPLVATISAIKSSGCNTSMIHVDSLSNNDVNTIVSTITKRPMEETMPLTEVVRQRTGGNPFFVLQFLRLLSDEGLLYYSIHTLQWEWSDLEEIKSAAKLSDQLADIVASTMKKLPIETQQVLMVASCLGAEVPFQILHEFMEEGVPQFTTSSMEEEDEEEEKGQSLVFHAQDKGTVATALDIAVKADILSQSNNKQKTTYKWLHDKLQSASYSLIPEHRRDLLHFRLGRLLWDKSLAYPEEEWMLYMAANQFNSGSTCLGVNPLDLARLNLQAANSSISKSAFYPAVALLRAGVGYLDMETSWKDDYDLCIELFNALAEMEFLVGNREACMDAVNVVLEYGRTIEDTSRAQSRLLDCVTSGSSRDYTEGIKMAIKTLKSYGLKIPLKNPQYQWNPFLRKNRNNQWMAQVSEKLESLTDMPKMVDLTALQLSKLLVHNLAHYASNAGDMDTMRLACMHALRLSVAHGINEHTCSAVQQLSIACMMKGDFTEAYRYSNLAVRLCAKFQEGPGTNHAKIQGVAHSSILAIMRPFHENLDPCLDAYRIGLKTGDMEFSSLCAVFYSLCYFCIGLPLTPLEPDLISFGHEARVFGRPASIVALFQIFRQTILNLQGGRSPCTALKGDAMDQDEMLGSLEGAGRSMTLRDVSTFRLILAVIYNDVPAKQELVDILCNYPLTDLIVFRAHIRLAFLGLAAISLGRELGIHKYETLGKTIIKKMKTDVKLEAVNSYPVLLMLQAEENPSKARYDESIKTCARSGLIHYEAYMYERAGLYFIRRNDEGSGEFYLGKALALYGDWGAITKVYQMKKDHGFLADSTALVGESGYFPKGRSRHSKKLCEHLTRYQV